jgi:hypothetical protein
MKDIIPILLLAAGGICFVMAFVTILRGLARMKTWTLDAFTPEFTAWVAKRYFPYVFGTCLAFGLLAYGGKHGWF